MIDPIVKTKTNQVSLQERKTRPPKPIKHEAAASAPPITRGIDPSTITTTIELWLNLAKTVLQNYQILDASASIEEKKAVLQALQVAAFTQTQARGVIQTREPHEIEKRQELAQISYEIESSERTLRDQLIIQAIDETKTFTDGAITKEEAKRKLIDLTDKINAAAKALSPYRSGESNLRTKEVKDQYKRHCWSMFKAIHDRRELVSVIKLLLRQRANENKNWFADSLRLEIIELEMIAVDMLAFNLKRNPQDLSPSEQRKYNGHLMKYSFHSNLAQVDMKSLFSQPYSNQVQKEIISHQENMRRSEETTTVLESLAIKDPPSANTEQAMLTLYRGIKETTLELSGSKNKHVPAEQFFTDSEALARNHAGKKGGLITIQVPWVEASAHKRGQAFQCVGNTTILGDNFVFTLGELQANWETWQVDFKAL